MTLTFKWSAAVGVLAGIIAIGSQLGGWTAIGWTTPNHHNADFESFEIQQQIANEEILDAIQNNQEEWRCDELQELLIELLESQVNGDSSTDTRRKIERVRNKLDKTNCSRFDDFD